MPKYGLGFYKDRIKYRGITPLNNLGHSGISLVTENQKKYTTLVRYSNINSQGV